MVAAFPGSFGCTGYIQVVVECIPSERCDKLWIMPFGALSPGLFGYTEMTEFLAINRWMLVLLLSWLKAKWPEATYSVIDFLSGTEVIAAGIVGCVEGIGR